MDTNEQVDELARRLEELKRRDRWGHIFGAGGPHGHRYRLGHPLEESQLLSFEREHRVELPPAYRLFLGRVGNGGAGPHYGLFPLEESLGENAEEFGPGFLATPFPWTESVNLCDAGEEIEEEFYAASSTSGSLLLAHEGCGRFDLLVVSGSSYGQVWSDARVSDGGVYLLAENFFEWYKGWLRSSLANFNIAI